MTTEKLYNAIESAFKNNKFNFLGVWDKITYSAKTLICERMVESGKWLTLPEEIEVDEESEMFV